MAPGCRWRRAAGMLVIAAASLLVVSGTSSQAALPRFRNVVNVPFATRANGPMGVVLADEDALAGRSSSALWGQIAADPSVANLQSNRRLIEFLTRHGIWDPRRPPSYPRTVVHATRGRLVQPDLSRAAAEGRQVGNGAITLAYKNWTADEEQALRAFFAAVVPVVNSVYGKPAFTMTVTVVKDEQTIAFMDAIYDATANEIRLPGITRPLDDLDTSREGFALIHMLIRAYHDDAMFYYDAWETGFAMAAAWAVAQQVDPNYDLGLHPFHAVPVYECLNQPELGNSTFYPPSGYQGMTTWRIGMAASAWFKAYIEDARFFRDANAAYYAAFDPRNPTLAGDIPALRQLVGGVLPQIEGMSFADWYERQYVLDTSVSLGPKLYVYNLPQNDTVPLVMDYYSTTVDGDEAPLGGTANLEYFDYQRIYSLFAQAGYQADIPASGMDAGVGFLAPSFFAIGGPQRVYVDVGVGGLYRTVIYPYGVRGPDEGGSNFIGAVLGADSGTTNLQAGSTQADLTVSQGAYGGSLGAALRPGPVALTFSSGSGQTVTRQVNVSVDYYVAFVQSGEATTLTTTFPVGANGRHMISVPAFPSAPDAATALGLSPNEFILSWWDPRAVGDDKYKFGPDVPPLGPGRGYWLKVTRDANVTLVGSCPPADQDYRIHLEPGWNMIGTPFDGEISLATLRFQEGIGAQTSFEEAVTRGWIRSAVFGYSQTGGYGTVTSLQPWRGYWIKVLRADGINIIFPGTGGRRARLAAPVRRASSDAGWQARLVAQTSDGAASTVTFGVAPSATAGFDLFADAESPPSAGTGIRAHFPHADWGANAGPYLVDIRGPSAGAITWDLEVSADRAGETVVVTWPSLAAVPRSVALTLVDLATGKRTYMRTTSHYAFESEGAARRLRIEATRDTGGRLVITNVVAVPTKGGGAEIGFRLSTAAEVTVRVRNIAGRLVATVAPGRAMSPGTNTVTWNLLGQGGAPVPNGTYLCEIVGATEDGQRASAVRTVSVVR
jgi:hypothetical protein